MSVPFLCAAQVVVWRMSGGVGVLEGKGDLYGGMAVPSTAVDTCESVEVFAERLGTSLDHWRTTGKRGIWLEIPSTRPELIPVACKMEFEVSPHWSPRLP
jgi:hypothetical protein